MPITDEHLRAAEMLIISPEGARIWRRLAFGWAKLGWLRKDTLVRFTIMCSVAGAYWDALKIARRTRDEAVRRHWLRTAEASRVAARESAVALGLLSASRAKLGEVNARGEDVDLLRVLPSAHHRRATRRRPSPANQAPTSGAGRGKP